MSDRSELAKFERKKYRDGYLQAKVRGLIAYQIQALREKTGLNQIDFAKKIGKTQSIVSRLEDTEYGRVTMQTLLDIACALDVALVVKFASYPEFLAQTRDASASALQPKTIKESLAGPNATMQRSGGAYERFLALAINQQGGSAQDSLTNENRNDERRDAETLVYSRSAPLLASQAGAA